MGSAGVVIIGKHDRPQQRKTERLETTSVDHFQVFGWLCGPSSGLTDVTEYGWYVSRIGVTAAERDGMFGLL